MNKVDKQNRQKKATTRSRWQYDIDVINQTKKLAKNMIKTDRQRWTLMAQTNIKEINMDMDVAEHSPTK
jgi:hypothetical protein